MKTQALIYDDNCPLCQWYSGLFVKYGFLKADERIPFSSIDNTMLQRIDFEKAKEEIPLLNVTTGKVVYGIDALVSILSIKFPFVQRICSISFVDWLLRKLYKLISYNRKVIVAKKCGTGAIDCAPSYNYFYRLLFLCIFLIFNTCMLLPVHQHLLIKLPGFHKSIAQVQAGHFILIAINCLLACTLPLKKAFEYIGQVNMLATVTVGLLLLFIPLANFLTIPGSIIHIYLLLLAIFIMKEYLRRMDYAGIITQHRWIAAVNLSSMAFLILLVIG